MPEVVDRGEKAALPVVADDVDDVGDVAHALGLGHFEDQPSRLEAAAFRRREREPDARGRSVDHVRHEVDRQARGHAEACRGFDRLDPAGLVEPVQLAGAQAPDDGRGALALRAAPRTSAS